jgi:hypothetical protein
VRPDRVTASPNVATSSIPSYNSSQLPIHVSHGFDSFLLKEGEGLTAYWLVFNVAKSQGTMTSLVQDQKSHATHRVSVE